MYKYIFEATFPDAHIDPYELKAEKPTKSPYYKSGYYPLVTTFHSEGSPFEPQIVQLMDLLAKFFQYGSDLFTKFKEMAGGMDEDVAKMLGEIRLTAVEQDPNEVFQRRTDKGVWVFKQCWPHSVNFGDLCYSSDPSMDIEVTWRFKECYTD